MSEPAMDLESTAGPSTTETPPRVSSPSPFVPSAPFKSGFSAAFKPTVTFFSPFGKDINQYKRKRSDTIPGPPAVREDIALKNPDCNYWEQSMAQTVTDSGVDPSQVDFGFIPIILGFLTELQIELT